jgi:hypothetical protein
MSEYQAEIPNWYDTRAFTMLTQDRRETLSPFWRANSQCSDWITGTLAAALLHLGVGLENGIDRLSRSASC